MGKGTTVLSNDFCTELTENNVKIIGTIFLSLAVNCVYSIQWSIPWGVVQGGACRRCKWQ